jgi:transcriptional regulator with XRE-family HTH domain
MDVQRMKDRRRQLNMTQADLADAMELAPSTIGSYEQGHREPDNDTLRRLADVLQTTTDYLLGKDIDAEGIVEANYVKLLGINALSDEEYQELLKFLQIPDYEQYLRISMEAAKNGITAGSLLDFVRTVKKARGENPSRDNQD